MGDAAAGENASAQAADVGTGGDVTRPRNRFEQLPDRVLVEDMVEEVPADTAKDPDFGRDPDRDWLLRTT